LFEIRFDLTDFERKAREMGAAQDQVPFALSLALNQAIRDTRTDLTETTWPTSVKERNPNFIRAALRYTTSTKRDLRAEIYDALGRASLKKHADGGTKVAKHAHLTIPPSSEPLGAHGIPKSKRARAIIARTPVRALRITPRGIFVGEHGRLKLKFVLKPSIRIAKDVPFRSDFRASMIAAVSRSFPPAMLRAMATRRK
jgi:hypothetical protein